MEIVDFTKETVLYDCILIVENKMLYCNKSMLSIWSAVFETMFKSNFKEKDSMEVKLPGKRYDDLNELLQVIYPPNKAITLANVERLLELADEYQMIELIKRCRTFLMQQRGTIEILLLGQRFQFEDVIKRSIDHLKHTLNTSLLAEKKAQEIAQETLNGLLITRLKHLETLIETFKRKLSDASDKFREIKALSENKENVSHCSRHSESNENCEDCMRYMRLIIKTLCEEGFEIID